MSDARSNRDAETKAERLIEQGRVRRDPDHPSVWWVQGNDPDREYRVQAVSEGTSPYVTCTCPHGLHAGAGQSSCYHTRAVEMVLRETTPEL